MKLARKLTLALLAVTVAVLALNAFERIERDRNALREDIHRDHRSLGHALRVVLLESFREDGEQRALSLVEAANQRESTLQISWSWLPERLRQPELAPTQRGALLRGEDVESVAEVEGVPWLSSDFPLRLDDGRSGTLQIRESLASESEAVRRTILHTIASTAIVALLAGIVTSWLGIWLVGRPVARLVQKARRVGAGDLSGPIELVSSDEIGDLSREMNAMCDRLDAESRARQHALEQLRHAERLATVGRLAAGIAHELGTPLNVVAIEAKRIAIGRSRGTDAEDAGRVIAEQAQRMTNIIRQLLDFARRRTPNPREVDLGQLTHDTLLLVGALAARQHVSLRHEQRERVCVRADSGQLAQVLTNLLMNAVQAMPQGGEVEIVTGCEHAESGAEARAFVRIRDRGIGIGDDALSRIFEPFFTTKEVGQGTGLGLAVAHGIVEEHGGVIEVESRVNEGATFTVRLPSVVAQEVA
jgi:signal transduction histidine kinase